MQLGGKPGWLEIKRYISPLVYADDVNILGGSVRTINNNTAAFLGGSKEIGL